MTTIPLALNTKRKRRSLEVVGWAVSLVAAVALGLVLYTLGSQTFTTTIDSPLALPKELAVTSNDANVPLPALGATTSTVPGATQSAAEAAGIATTPTTTPTTAAASSTTPATSTTPTTAAARATTPTTAAPATTRSTAATTAAPAPVLRNTTATTSAPAPTTPVTAAPTTTPTTSRSLPTPTLPAPVVNAVGDLLGGN